jgi:hypothetical protein
MLGAAYMYSKNRNGQRRRIDESTQNDNKLTRQEYKNNKMNSLASKYFNKITNAVIKASSNGKNEIHFYYNYYDFVNNGLGKPHGFLNEFMSEMCYEYSLYVTKDDNDNPMTFKTLFGFNFKWELHGKNMMIISW